MTISNTKIRKIRTLAEEGVSTSNIAHQCKVDYKTVKKYINSAWPVEHITSSNNEYISYIPTMAPTNKYQSVKYRRDIGPVSTSSIHPYKPIPNKINIPPQPQNQIPIQQPQPPVVIYQRQPSLLEILIADQIIRNKINSMNASKQPTTPVKTKNYSPNSIKPVEPLNTSQEKKHDSKKYDEINQRLKALENKKSETKMNEFPEKAWDDYIDSKLNLIKFERKRVK